MASLEHITYYRAGRAIVGFFSFLLLLVISILVGSYFVKVDIVQILPGRIQNDSGQALVLMPVDATIDRFLVEIGEDVTQGQRLIDLDLSRLEFDREAVLAQLAAQCDQWWGAKLSLANAFEALPHLAIPLPGQRQPGPCLTPTRAIQDQALADRSSLRQQVSVTDSQIQALGVRQVAVDNALKNVNDQLTTARAQRDRNAAMLARQLISRITFEDSDSQVLRLQAQELELARERALIPVSQAELEGGLNQRVSERIDQNMQTLVLSASQSTELAANLATIDHKLSAGRAVIAPIDGYISQLEEGLVGTPQSLGSTIMTLTPTSNFQTVRVALSPSNVGFAQPGDTAIIKIDSYPYQRYGHIEGVVKKIVLGRPEPTAPGPSSNKRQDSSGSHVVIAITDLSTLKVEPELALRSGLTLKASIITGQRNVLSYFTDPISDGLTNSLGEF